MRRRFAEAEYGISGWMDRYGRLCLRISLAIIFVWFGALKVFGASPANDLVHRTIYWLPSNFFIPFLGYWEILIGLGLLAHRFMRTTLSLLFLQMAGTLLPFFTVPEVCFTSFPFGLTLEGQYIVKNLCLISAAIVIGGTIRPKLEHARTPD